MYAQLVHIQLDQPNSAALLIQLPLLLANVLVLLHFTLIPFPEHVKHVPLTMFGMKLERLASVLLTTLTKTELTGAFADLQHGGTLLSRLAMHAQPTTSITDMLVSAQLD